MKDFSLAFRINRCFSIYQTFHLQDLIMSLQKDLQSVSNKERGRNNVSFLIIEISFLTISVFCDKSSWKFILSPFFEHKLKVGVVSG